MQDLPRWLLSYRDVPPDRTAARVAQPALHMSGLGLDGTVLRLFSFADKWLR